MNSRLPFHSPVWATAWLALLLVAHTAAARGIHYGAVSDAAVVACDQQHWRGETAQSLPCYRDILSSNASSAAKAEAAWALNDMQAANQYFRSANAEHPGDIGALTRWGDLYAASHQEAEAMNIYREALQIDSAYGFALLGAATVLIGGFDEAATVYMDQLLNASGIADGARVGAWLLAARLALESSDIAAARQALNESGDIISRNEWPPLNNYALRAAADLLDGVAQSEWTQTRPGLQPTIRRDFCDARLHLRNNATLPRRHRLIPEGGGYRTWPGIRP